MKRRSLKKMKVLMSIVTIFSIILSISLPMIASGYGADTDDWQYSSAYIRNVASGKYMTVPSGTVANGKEIKIYEATENISQQWGVYKLEGDYYCIRSEIDDNYVLYVENANDSNGSKIVLKYLADGATVPTGAQFMMFSMDTLGSAYLISRLSVNNGTLRAIDCENDGYVDGTKLVINSMGSELEYCVSQLWVFECTSRSVELNSWDLVDSAGHCDWDCNTDTYASMIRKATNAWNDYIGDEVFRPDAWNVIQDVSIKEMKEDPTGGNSFGRTYTGNIFNLEENQRQYAASIYFYTDEMKDLENLQIEKVVMHELGHALGLGHNRTAGSSNKLGNIMQQGELPYSTFISLDDRASVEEAYSDY